MLIIEFIFSILQKDCSHFWEWLNYRKAGKDMDRSMMSMIYFVALLALFLIMIIATIAVIASKSRRRFDDEDDEFEDGEFEEDSENRDADVQNYADEGDEVLDDDFYVDNLDEDNPDERDLENRANDIDVSVPDADDYEDEYADDAYDEYEEYEDVEIDENDADFEDAFAPSSAFVDPVQANAPTQEIDTKAVKEERDRTTGMEDARKEENEEKKEPVDTIPVIGEQEAPIEKTESEEPDETDTIFEEAAGQALEESVEPPTEESIQVPAGSQTEDISEQDSEDEPAEDEVAEPVEKKPLKKKHMRRKKEHIKPEIQEKSADSAFAADMPGIDISNEALAASVKEAEAMGAAIMGDLKAAQVPAETMFGINEQLSSYGEKKSKRAKSNVKSDEDFYWYNKEDVADRPARRPAELYYHHFNLASDCIEDLLVEMYDCALVRTEEIRYIAYGIEPKTMSMKEIMSGKASSRDQKKKDPTTQDMVRIYEKWCGYVDRLLDHVVEIHADEYTINEIRKQLCEYGRNDVDVLLEGK